MSSRSLPALSFALAASILLFGWSCGFFTPGGGEAQVIFHNASFYTEKGVLADGALALSGGRIQALGPKDKVVAAWQGPKTRFEDLEGGFACPGMFDSLGCLFKLATSLNRVDLVDCHSFHEVVAKVRQEVERRPAGTWIVGMGWDQNLWDDHALPTHQELSRAVPDHPVWLWRVDVMCGLANAKAMEMCRINLDTPDPKGGVIGRDKKERPNGLFFNTAVDLIEDRIPAPSRSEVKRRLLQAQEHCFRCGLTGIFVPGVERDEVGLLKEMVDEGTWRLPVCLSYRSGGDPDALAGLIPLTNYKGVMEARCLSIYLDGGLGSRGAALLEDYSDEPLNKGILNYSPDEVREVVQAAFRSGFQLSLHCVGDRAAKVALDAVEKTFCGAGAPDRRWRIEHSQMVTSADRRRFKKLGIIPSMQPYHCPSDMDWAPSRVGRERLDRLYNWRAFADMGLPIAGGSFFPVESADPLKGIYAAVTTQREDGTPEGGFLPRCCMTRKEAIDLFTRNAAFAVHQEERRGVLEPGKEAYLTVYDRNIMEVPPREILAAKVTRTVVAGEVVYRHP